MSKDSADIVEFRARIAAGISEEEKIKLQKEIDNKIMDAKYDLQRWQRSWPEGYGGESERKKILRDLETKRTILLGQDEHLLQLQANVKKYTEYVAERANKGSTPESEMFAQMIDADNMRSLAKAQRELAEYIV